MKRLSTLFLTLAALLLALPANVRADGGFLSIGDRITPDEIVDGLKVILEGGAEQESLGKYMPQLPTSADEGTNLSASLDEGCVYQFVDAGTTNSVSGDKEWYLLNVYTGKYVAFGSENYYLVDGKENAVKLTVHAANDPTYGAAKKAGADYEVGWDDNSITLAQIARNDEGNTVVTYVNNHFYTVIDGKGAIVGWEYQDTSAWNLRGYSTVVDYVQILQSYLEGFTEETLQNYAYGTDPGFISDEAVVDKLNDIYSEAVLKVDRASSDEAKDLYDRLVAARAAADSSATVAIPDDGYFYIFTGHPGFINGNAGGNFAIFPANDGSGLSWKAFNETDYSFVWHFTKDENGHYVVKNAATGVYIDQGASNGNSERVLVSKENETPQVLTPRSPNGKYLICAEPNLEGHFYFNMGGHSGGTGRSGSIVTWSSANDVSNLWYLRTVPQEVIDAINNDPDLTALRSLVTEYESGSQSIKNDVGTNPFQYPEDAVNNFTAAYEAGKNLVDAGGTSDEYKAAVQKLQDAVDAMEASRVQLTTGYYNIVSGFSEYLKQQGVEKAMYSNGNSASWQDLSTDNNSQKWLITPIGDGLYTVKNALTNKYLSKPASNGTSQQVSVSDDVDTIRIAPFNNFTNEVNLKWKNYDMMYHTAGHNGGSGASGNVVTWNDNVNTGSSWVIRSTGTAGVLEEQLQNEVSTADRTLARAYTYNYNASQPQITDASQIWSNNKEETEGTYEALINNDITNDGGYFHSNWHTTPDNLKDSYDNLCFYKEDGFPDKVVFTFATRRQGNVTLAPTVMDIYVSNDTTAGWTKARTVYNFTAVNVGVNEVYTSQEITTGGAKFFRMDVVETVASATGGQRNTYGHPWFALTEMNIYPSEGLSSTAQYNDALVKQNADAVSALIATSEQKIAAKTVAQSDIDALTAAVKTLSDSYFDIDALTNRVNEIKAYAALFGDNEEWGDVQPEEKDELNAALDAALEGYDASNPSRAEIDSRLQTLNAAFDLFKSRQKLPEADTWYYIANTDTTRTGASADQAFSYGNVIMAPHTSNTYDKRKIVADAISWGGYDHDAQAIADSVANDPYSMWRLVKYEGTEDTDGGIVYALQNRATGYYLGASANHNGRFGLSATPVPYKLSLLWSGQLNIICTVAANTDKRPLHAGGANKLVVSWEGGVYSPSSWTFNPVTDDVVNAHINIANNKATILTLPYAYDEAAASENDINGVQTYAIKGISDDGTELYLYKKRTFEAGEPMIAVAGEIDNEPVTETAIMTLPLANEFSYEAKIANGLVPTFDLDSLPGNVGLIKGDTVASTGATATTVNGMRGYIDASKITTDNTKTTDLTLYVKGSIVNNIAKTLAGAKNGKVNVYTIDGVVVKKNVKASEAKSGLKKGVYIIGNEKTLVK